jgi:hypothetical protein
MHRSWRALRQAQDRPFGRAQDRPFGRAQDRLNRTSKINIPFVVSLSNHLGEIH